MPRPTKEGLDYFPHDTDAVNDEKIEALRSLYGNDGYAFYFILLERIYRTPHQEIDVSESETIQVLARKIEVTKEKFAEMLQTALRWDCFDKKRYAEEGILTSNGIKKRALPVLQKRASMRDQYREDKAGKVSGEFLKQKRRVKERKGKELKGKENIYTQDEQEILDLWNSKDIVKHEPTLAMQKEISKALKKYGRDNIVIAINNYVTAYRDAKFYYSNRWRLDKFLKQSNGLPDFLEEGQRWINYTDSKGKNSKPANKRESAWKEYDRDKKGITKRDEAIDNLCNDLEAKLNERNT